MWSPETELLTENFTQFLVYKQKRLNLACCVSGSSGGFSCVLGEARELSCSVPRRWQKLNHLMLFHCVNTAMCKRKQTNEEASHPHLFCDSGTCSLTRCNVQRKGLPTWKKATCLELLRVIQLQGQQQQRRYRRSILYGNIVR